MVGGFGYGRVQEQWMIANGYYRSSRWRSINVYLTIVIFSARFRRYRAISQKSSLLTRKKPSECDEDVEIEKSHLASVKVQWWRAAIISFRTGDFFDGI